MHNMANHGKSNQDPKLLGYFGEKDGYKNLVKDLKSVYDLAKRNFPIKNICLRPFDGLVYRALL